MAKKIPSSDKVQSLCIPCVAYIFPCCRARRHPESYIFFMLENVRKDILKPALYFVVPWHSPKMTVESNFVFLNIRIMMISISIRQLDMKNKS